MEKDTQKTICILGATGFLGRALVSALHQKGWKLLIGTRNFQKGKKQFPFAQVFVWREKKESETLCRVFSNTHAVIHLGGASLWGWIWTKRRKKYLFRSRVESTQAVVAAIEALPRLQRPKVFLCASAIGFYGDRGEEVLVEESVHGSGFLSELCQVWEQTAQKAQAFGVRVVLLRTALVLSWQGGLLALLKPFFQFGLGVQIGDGQNWVSWIARSDWVRAVLFALEEKSIHGPVNLSSPNPVRFSEFGSRFAWFFKKPFWIRVPVWIVKGVLGSMSELVCTGAQVLPQRLMQCGFSFKKPTLKIFFDQKK